ncbi:MAG TPA: helix-turn-helix transcriptional regulator [Myxococcales bacterium LLY-WYZ-16_1]|nr:helix-turn-helix transcriptional regulator [Myxococcales bacterium LLY-WYZ-16_1]
MSSAPPSPPGPHTQPHDDEAGSPGTRLARARTEQSISIAELSQRTRISAGTLRALEEERFADVPNARVYVRGFVRAFAQEVGLDPDETTKAYLEKWETWARR